MTGLERCRRAMDFRRPDRVPVIPQAHIWSLYYYGSTSRACMNDGFLYADLQIRAQQEFGWDGVFVATDSVALAHSLGTPVEMTETGVVPGTKGLFDSVREARDLELPDPRETRLNEWVRATQVLVKEIGSEVLVIARADQGPFSLAAQLCGMQEFLTALGTRDHPEGIHRILRMSMEYVWSFASLLLDAGAHVVTIGDALASGSIISPAMFDEYAFPYQKEIGFRVHRKGGRFGIHVCGDTSAIMRRLAETGADIVEFDAPTDFAGAWDASRGRVCLLGNVDTSEVLTFGTPGRVVEECRRRIEAVLPESGYMVSSGCALSPNVPAENLRAMVSAAREYGVY